MSHFAVLVIGDNVEEQLAPYHEFECTGINDEYVQDVDILQEAKDGLEKHTERKLKDPDGNLYDRYDNMFYRDPTPEEKEKIGIGGTGVNNEFSYTSKDWGDGLGYRTRVLDTRGWEEVEVPSEKNLREYADYWYGINHFVQKDEEPDLEDEGKYGYGVVDENGEIIELYNRTNPDARWDWYVVGGRYAGRLKLKEGVEMDDVPNFSWGWNENDKVRALLDRRVDSALKGDIDWDSIHQNQEDYDKAIRFWEMKVEGAEPETDEEKDQVKWDWYKDGYYEERYGDKETFAKCRSNFTMWAILSEEHGWLEKGEMGWFGASGESHDEAVAWELYMYDRFIKDLPDDTRLTVVDCHI